MEPTPSLRHLIVTSHPPKGRDGDAILVFHNDRDPEIYAPDGKAGWVSFARHKDGAYIIPGDVIRWMWVSEAGPGVDSHRRVMDQVMAAVDEAGRTTTMVNHRTDTLEDLTYKVKMSVARLRMFLWGRELTTTHEGNPAPAAIPEAGLITHVNGQPLPTPVPVAAGDTIHAAAPPITKIDVRAAVLHGDGTMSVAGRVLERAEAAKELDFARLVVRPDAEAEAGNKMLLMLGTSRGLFEPGVVYQIHKDFFGELEIQRIGASSLDARDWLHSVHSIIEDLDGAHLLTEQEVALRAERRAAGGGRRDI
jgi:hypothetical protein